MNFNISFSSFQETGQTGTKHLLNLLKSPDDAELNKKDDQLTLFLPQFDHRVFSALPEQFCGWISLLLKMHENDW